MADAQDILAMTDNVGNDARQQHCLLVLMGTLLCHISDVSRD
jgi:hypothetical protein